MNPEPNYKAYSLAELEESLEYIDKNLYPERAEILKREILLRKSHTESQENSINKVEYVTPSGNWLLLHWKGLLPLEVTYWINVFVLSFVVTLLMTFLSDYFSKHSAKAVLTGLTIMATYAAVTVITIWQLVGLYRSASKHVERGGTETWATVAKLLVIVGVLKYSYEMVETGIPFIVESSALVTGKSTLPSYSIRVMNGASEIEVLGGLEFGVSEELSERLKANPNIKIIHLNSLGGRISEAKKLARLIKDHNLKTYVRTKCLSACPIAFLAGHERLLGEEAELGFHSASFGSVSGSKVKELNNNLIDELKSAKVPESIVRKITSTSSEDIWFPSSNELLRSNIIDRIVDSGDYALSGVSDWQNPQDIDQDLLEHELYKTIYEFDPEGYSAIKEEMIRGIKAGSPSNKITGEIRNYLYGNRLSYYLHKGGDVEVVQYELSQVNQMRFLQQSYPKECASYMYPDLFESEALKDISKVLEPKLLGDEADALIAVIKSNSSSQSKLNETERNDAIASVLKSINSNHNIPMSVFSKPVQFKDSPEKICMSAILFSEAIASLPIETASPVIRSLY